MGLINKHVRGNWIRRGLRDMKQRSMAEGLSRGYGALKDCELAVEDATNKGEVA